MLSALTTILKALPEIIALVQTLKAAADKAQTAQKVKEDLNVIQAAFQSGDVSKLNDLFNRR